MRSCLRELTGSQEGHTWKLLALERAPPLGTMNSALSGQRGEPLSSIAPGLASAAAPLAKMSQLLGAPLVLQVFSIVVQLCFYSRGKDLCRAQASRQHLESSATYQLCDLGLKLLRLFKSVYSSVKRREYLPSEKI